MPITFESPKDPYGLGALAGAVGGYFGSTVQARRQEEADIRKKQREQDLIKEKGQVLGTALQTAQDPSKNIVERMGALQNYVSQTGDTSVLPLIRELGKEARTNALLSQFGIGGSPGAQLSAPTEFQTTGDPTPQSTSTLSSIPEDRLVAMSAIPELKPVAEAELKKREIDQKKFEGERKYHSQTAIPYMKSIDEERDALRKQELSQRELDSAIAEANTGGFTINNIARIFNRPELLSASGAQLVGASKELLIANLGTISGRPNQFLEQQFTFALPELGKSKAANATLAESTRANSAIIRAKHEISDRLADEDMKRYGYVRNDVGARVSKEMAPIAREIEDRAAFRVKEIIEGQKSDRELRKDAVKKVPQGTPLTPKMAAIFLERHGTPEKAFENAKKLGYDIISLEKIEEYRRAR